jgi:O-antigen ligase
MGPGSLLNSHSGHYSLAKADRLQGKASDSQPRPEKLESVDAVTEMFWGLLVFSLPFNDIQFPKAARGFGQPSTYLALVLCVFVLLRTLREKESLRFLKNKAFLFMFLFWVVAGISIYQSLQAPVSPWLEYSDPLLVSVGQFAQLSVCLSVAVLTCYFVRGWRDFRFAMALYFAGWIGSVLVQALDFVAYFRPNSTLLQAANEFIHNTPLWQFEGPFPRLRLAGSEGSWASDYLICLIPFFVLGSYYWRSRRWNIVNASAALIVLFATMSFGGLAVFLGQAALMAMILGRRAVKFLALAGAAPLLLALVISPAYVSVVWDRTVESYTYGAESGDFSVRMRMALVESAWNAFQEHPWLGVGIGESPFYVPGDWPTWAARDPSINWTLRTPANLCNLHLQILSETGLVGSALFVALLVTMVGGTFKAYRRATEPWKRSVYAGVLVALLGQIAHYSSMNRFFLHYWFFIWGLAICTVRLAEQADAGLRVHRILYRRRLAGELAPAGASPASTASSLAAARRR